MEEQQEVEGGLQGFMSSLYEQVSSAAYQESSSLAHLRRSCGNLLPQVPQILVPHLLMHTYIHTDTRNLSPVQKASSNFTLILWQRNCNRMN